MKGSNVGMSKQKKGAMKGKEIREMKGKNMKQKRLML